MTAPARRIHAVVVAVVVFHVAWVALYLVLGHELRDLIHIGERYVTQSTASTRIVVDPDYDYDSGRDASARFAGSGYDGQFSYYMALDPVRAHHYMDVPAYRYQRPLYPAAAWLLSAGIDDLLPLAMLLVNLIAVGAGTGAVALYLKRHGASPWWASAYGLAPGMLIAVQRDLTEPLAYGLAALGIVAMESGVRRPHVLAGVLFALAALARQTTLVIPIVYALWLLGSSDAGIAVRLRRAATVAGIAALPYAGWALFVSAWLEGSPTGESPDPVPLGWLFDRAWTPARQPVIVVFALVPAAVWTVVALSALRRGHRRAVWACLAANVLAFLVVAPAYNAYTSVGRVVLGAVLMAVLAVPFLSDLTRLQRRAVAAASAVWASMAPVVAVYGLTTFSV